MSAGKTNQKQKSGAIATAGHLALCHFSVRAKNYRRFR